MTASNMNYIESIESQWEDRSRNRSRDWRNKGLSDEKRFRRDERLQKEAETTLWVVRKDLAGDVKQLPRDVMVESARQITNYPNAEK